MDITYVMYTAGEGNIKRDPLSYVNLSSYTPYFKHVQQSYDMMYQYAMLSELII